MVSIDKPQHTQAVLEHNQDMLALRENIFMHLQATREYKEKLLIVTAPADADVAIELE